MRIFNILVFASIFLLACGSNKSTKQMAENEKIMDKETNVEANSKAVLGGGCFWCIETLFADLQGVDTVLSGYAGGQIKNPTYKEICSGNTGHAEVIEVNYDSSIITFAEILEIFFNVHDPTTLNRQGNDVGTQYRSCIMYSSEKQKEISQAYIKQLNESGVFDSPIVTTLEPLKVLYVAEDYHQNYYNENGEQPYCQFVVRPKVEKFKKQYKDKLK